MTKAATLAQQASSTTFNIPFRNRVINGAMAIDQRYNGAATTNVGSYGGSPTHVVDRFRIGGSGGGARWTMQRVQDGPPGFQYSAKFTTTTASAPAAADLTVLSHIIEGYNVHDFAWGTASAQAASLSFWVKASVAGTYNVTITSGPSATYTTTYTVSAANVWEYETITIPACTSFTSGLSNDQGIRIDWAMAVGSNYITATPNSWNASSYYGTSGAVQLSNNSGATWQITGVQFEPGGSATNFDVRPYGVELGLCQRYYQTNPRAVTFGRGTDSIVYNHVCPVPMRAVPSVAMITTAPYYESTVWSTVGSLTNAVANNGHMSTLGGDILISGTFSPSPAGNYLTEIGGGVLAISAEL